MWCVAVTTSVGHQQNALIVGPQFEVVSIKLNPGVFATGPPVQRPDGGLRMTHVPAMVLIGRAYPPVIPNQMDRAPRVGED